jgi:hypothetical protein
MVHGEGMLVAKKAAASDTAHQWSSFAPQNRRCLHGRGGQPLKARADAGNEVAEVEKMRNTRWRGAIGPRRGDETDQSKPDHTHHTRPANDASPSPLRAAARWRASTTLPRPPHTATVWYATSIWLRNAYTAPHAVVVMNKNGHSHPGAHHSRAQHPWAQHPWAHHPPLQPNLCPSPPVTSRHLNTTIGTRVRCATCIVFLGNPSPAHKHRVHVVQIPVEWPTRTAAAPAHMYLSRNHSATAACLLLPCAAVHVHVHVHAHVHAHAHSLFPRTVQSPPYMKPNLFVATDLARPCCSNEKAGRAIAHHTFKAARSSQPSVLQALALGAASLLGLTVPSSQPPTSHLTPVPPRPRRP